MMNSKIRRREFLSASGLSITALASVSSAEAGAYGLQLPSQSSPPEGLRFGIIGVGMEGSGLLKTAISLPGIECVGAADLYDGRHLLAKQITGNADLFTTRRYQELLKRPDVDCILAAVPDHWHKRVVVDACNAGKDIYCEKPMSHTIMEGFEMVKAAEKNKRIVQIGSQRVSSSLCAKAHELYTAGTIGEVEMVELTYGRNSPNGAWEYPPPPDLSPSNFDWDTWLNDAPKVPFDPERFARWRCWKEYGTGVGGDLMVHLLSGMLYTLGWNEAPRSASALGGIFRWKDGRNMPDFHAVLFDYHGIPVYVRLDLGSATPEIARFLGPKGVMEAQGTCLRIYRQTGEDDQPSYYSDSFPAEMRAQYVKQWHEQHPRKFGREPLTDNLVFDGPDWDDLKPHLETFFSAVRTRKPVVEDAVFGNHAAIGCHMANESYFRNKPVYWSESSHELTT
ncbi:MAG: Gfo/Idh/MocA family oxidoreductase [Acidobacteriaceae bacterium]|nr:Gfo/Idh/MocA family oxidoreductase [Acidobacteriaceae bacterium]